MLASYCPVGWTYYKDTLGTEGHDSCLKMTTSYATSWSTGMSVCPIGSHGLTIMANSTTTGLMPFAIALSAQSAYKLNFGCSQSSTALLRAMGWSWVDGTRAGNLNCGGGIGGNGCGIWGPLQPE